IFFHSARGDNDELGLGCAVGTASSCAFLWLRFPRILFVGLARGPRTGIGIGVDRSLRLRPSKGFQLARAAQGSQEVALLLRQAKRCHVLFSKYLRPFALEHRPLQVRKLVTSKKARRQQSAHTSSVAIP